MLTPTDPAQAAALDTAITAPVRRFSWLLEVDWNRNGLFTHPASNMSTAVESIQVRRELADDLPVDAPILTGTAAATLTVRLNGHLVIGGTPWPVATLLAPYNDLSPLFGVTVEGTPIRWSIITKTPLGDIPVRQFTGFLDDQRIARKNNLVRWTALDGAVLLDNPATITPWAVDSQAAKLAGTSAALRGLGSSVIDHLANRAGLRTSPTPRWVESPTTTIPILDIPLHGSWAPSIGWMGHFPYQVEPDVRLPPVGDRIVAGQQVINPWIPGPHGLARNSETINAPGQHIYRGANNPVIGGRETAIMMWAYIGPDVKPAGVPAGGYAVLADFTLHVEGGDTTKRAQIKILTDGPRIRVIRTADSFTGTATSAPIVVNGWYPIWLRDNHNASYEVRVADIVVLSAGVGAAFSNRATYAGALLTLSPAVPMCDVRVWQETAPNAPRGALTVVPGAVIDPGLNELTHHPRVTGTGWRTIRDVTAAEFGAVLFDEEGIFRFLDRDTLAAGDDAGTITVASITDIGTTTTALGAANTIRVTALPGAATFRTVFDSEDPFLIIAPPGATKHIIPMPDLISCEEWLFRNRYKGDVDTVPSRAPGGAWTPKPWKESVVHGYSPSLASGASADNIVGSQIVLGINRNGLYPEPAVAVDVTIRSDEPIIFALPNDQDNNGTDQRAAFKFGGCGLTLDEPSTEILTAALHVARDKRVRAIDVGGGRWHQHMPSVRAAGQYLLRFATQAIPTFDAITTPGDPRRQLTDQFILELGDSGPRVRANIVGITRTQDNSGVADVVTFRATHASGRWALGDPVLGRIGSTAVLG